MTRRLQERFRVFAVGSALALSLAGPAVAQRGQFAPPQLEATFNPATTQVEFIEDAAVVTFDDRTYRIQPIRNPSNPERGRQMSLQGSGIMPSSTSSSYFRRNFADYYNISGPNEFWLLPGYGLVAAYDYLDQFSGRRRVRQHLIRGLDGTLEPPLPGRPPFWESHFVARAGVQANNLIAERTLFITGSLSAYRSEGLGASTTLQPIGSVVSLAWLFDEDGLIQQWSPLVDLSGNTGSTTAATNAFVYQRRSDQGHVTFATRGADGYLDVHVVSPGWVIPGTAGTIKSMKCEHDR